MKKQVLTFLMVLAMVVSLAACGGGDGDGGSSGGNSPVGTYQMTSMNSDGMEMTAEDLTALFGTDVEITLEIKDDNSFTLDLGFLVEDESVSGTWAMEGDSLKLSAEGDSISVTYDGKTIVMDVDGEILTFEKQ